jgi:hypothetical protein
MEDEQVRAEHVERRSGELTDAVVTVVTSGAASVVAGAGAALGQQLVSQVFDRPSKEPAPPQPEIWTPPGASQD